MMMGSVIFLLFIVLFFVFVFSLFSAAEGRPRTLMRRRSGRAQRKSRINQAALAAMRRAGYEADDSYVQVADIGLLAYRQTDEPKLVRYGAVLMDARYLRPFVEVWLPYAASGTLRFELVDGAARLRYADEARYDLARGQNTLLPDTWLPLEGKPIGTGEWTLKVLAGDTLLASHGFGWQAVGGGHIQQYVEADGEIGAELQQAMRGKPREAVSLADLLADQEE